jgi:hypothetical protein
MRNEITWDEVTANISGAPRTVTEDGHAYWVVPLTMIVPGVLNGSKGPLYYPPDEIRKAVDSWNGMPITRGHPTDRTGQHVRALDPKANTAILGWVRNARINTGKDGRLQAEGWFEVARMQKHPDLLSLLKAGKKAEISTGLLTVDQPAPPGSHHNGVAYTHIARNHQPDHLAILLDQTGACSLKAGCGLNVNLAHKEITVNDLVQAIEAMSQDQRLLLLTAVANACRCKAIDDEEGTDPTEESAGSSTKSAEEHAADTEKRRRAISQKKPLANYSLAGGAAMPDALTDNDAGPDILDLPWTHGPAFWAENWRESWRGSPTYNGARPGRLTKSAPAVGSSVEAQVRASFGDDVE